MSSTIKLAKTIRHKSHLPAGQQRKEAISDDAEGHASLTITGLLNGNAVMLSEREYFRRDPLPPLPGI
jgi:hypothetical protein